VNRIGWSRESASLGAIVRTAAQNTDAAAAITIPRADHLVLAVMLSGGAAVVMVRFRFKAGQD
jgi:hypothetical protein